MLVANGENVLNTIVLFCTTSVRLTEVFASICKTTFYMKLLIKIELNIEGDIIITMMFYRTAKR